MTIKGVAKLDRETLIPLGVACVLLLFAWKLGTDRAAMAAAVEHNTVQVSSMSTTLDKVVRSVARIEGALRIAPVPDGTD